MRKYFVDAMLILFISTCIFLFFGANKKYNSYNVWFAFTGDASDMISILDPLNYTLLGQPPSESNTDLFLQAVHVNSSSEVYPATDLLFPGKPKVDISMSDLQNDILMATDIQNGRQNPFEIANRILLKETNNSCSE